MASNRKSKAQWLCKKCWRWGNGATTETAQEQHDAQVRQAQHDFVHAQKIHGFGLIGPTPCEGDLLVEPLPMREGGNA